MNRPLLILDLDETLVYASSTELCDPPSFQVDRFAVCERPHLAGFIDYCFSAFEVAVWTSAGSDYAAAIVSKIFAGRPLHFVWSFERCTQRTNPETYERYTVKDLRKVAKLGYALERVLMIDDSPEKLERNYGNHIRVRPFEGDASDRELFQLVPYLKSIQSHPNFRTIEKRHWRSTVT